MSKRGYDDEGFDDTSKRQKVDAAPSKVLHVRNLPQYTTEAELIALCSPYGTVVRILLLHNSQQGFIQMNSVEAASNLLTRYSIAPAVIRGKSVYFQYSSRPEISAQSASQPDSQQQASTILLVTVLNQKVPVTMEHFHQIFKPYGEVQKIVIFSKNNQFKALVQMGTLDSAINAKTFLEGKDMFQNCCHLRLAFSSLSELKVSQNGPKARDFTVTDPSWSAVGLLMGGPNGYFGGYDQPPPPSHSRGGPHSGGSVLLASNLPDGMTTDQIFTLFGVYGDVIRIKILYNKRDTALIQFVNSQHARSAQSQLNRVPIYGRDIAVSFSKNSEIQMSRPSDDPDVAKLTKDFSRSASHRFKSRGPNDSKGVNPPSPVLHVSNISDSISEADLRHLFGSEQQSPLVQVFNANTKRQAFICMDSVGEAVLALVRCHNYKLADKYLRVSFSHKDPASIKESGTMDSY